MSQSNQIDRRISPRSLAGHERLPVRLRHVASANRYNEMSLCSISLYRAAGQARCYASVAKRHISYQQVFKIPSASASTRPHGLRKPAARYLPYSAYLICGLGKVDDLASNKRLLLRCLMLRIVFAEEYTVEKVSVSCLEFRLDVNLYGHVQVIVR